MPNITIDAEFKALIPPISADEYERLEANIIADGCRDPLVLWHGILIDGHNRFEICKTNGLPFKTVQVDLKSRDDVMDWMDANQLGRRNLNPDQFTLLLGRRYNRAKKAIGENQHTMNRGGHNDHPTKTAESLAGQHGVSEKTVRRAGEFADAVDKLELTKEVNKGTSKISRGNIVKAAGMLESNPEATRQILKGEKTIPEATRDVKKESVIESLTSIAAVKAKEVLGKFDVIVIDPPWPMKKINRDERPNQAGFDYPVMSESELVDLEIPMADNCHVWLWTTHKFLPMAFRLLDLWGLKYVCAFTWHKPGGFQPFGLPQYNCEFALYARRGTPIFIDTKDFPVCFDAARGAHSEKPAEFYARINRVTAGRRLDMFNRRKFDGFIGWGNEAMS